MKGSNSTDRWLLKVLKRIDILIINDEEARQLSGELSLLKAATKILEMGPQALVIKKGEHGALLFHGDQVFSAPALLLPKVVDPTGAGDTFVGGLMGYLAAADDLNFENLKRAIVHGSALASFVVEDFGTRRLKTLDKEQIQGRVQQIAKLKYNLIIGSEKLPISRTYISSLKGLYPHWFD